jgi:hypothetical protein
MNITENLILALGWQGGTVYQVAGEIGLDVSTILEIGEYNSALSDFNSACLSQKGFDSVLVQYRKHAITNIYPQYTGCPHFWRGVVRGVQHVVDCGDHFGVLNPSK